MFLMNSYSDLDIYQLAFELAKDVHFLTMKLPKHELYEQGSQVRRSTQSIKDNIAEGFGRRRYKNDFIRFLIYAHASCDESMSQLIMINELYFKEKPILDLIEKNDTLGRKINAFIQYVEKSWKF